MYRTPILSRRMLLTTAITLAVAFLASSVTSLNAQSLDRPNWKKGDRWTVETQTDRIQGREATPVRSAATRIRWQFRVAEIESLAGQECYRIEVKCQARGRLRPSTTIWCEKDTLFLRQIRTQLPVAGRYRQVVESYQPGRGNKFSPVVASINALPIALPAFVPEGVKSTGSYLHTSAPQPAGTPKSLDIVQFAHSIEQNVQPAGSKSLENLPPTYIKNLSTEPITEVKLRDHQQTVVQLWKKGSPWPVYTDNGRTKAYLVSSN